MQVGQERMPFYKTDPRVMSQIGVLEPLECLIGLATESVCTCNLESPLLPFPEKTPQ